MNSPNDESNPRPSWVNSLFYAVTQLLVSQPMIATHRSKLYSLFDDFRSFMKSFDPDYSLKQQTIQQICKNFADAVSKTQQIVFACSSSHWTTAAVSWSHNSVYNMVQRIRADLSACVSQFGCRSTTEFILPESELNAQNNVDILQLKSSLMDYQETLKDKTQNPQVPVVLNMISERIRSIGPIDGVQDDNGLTVIPPFLPPHLNLVLQHNDFIMGEKIGSGTFGCVYVGTITAKNNPNVMKKVAVKVLNLKTLGGRQLETFKREVWTMATLNHPAILRLIGVTLTPPFCIVTELLNDSLYHRMRFLSPTKKSIIMLCVALGLAYLHAARIIHRDLKSSNILLDENDYPRVCDFGLVGFRKGGTHTGFVGTTQWMAPELLKSSPFYTEKVDVYSYAVMMWEVLTNQQPFTGMTQDQIVMAVIEKKARPLITPNFGPRELVSLIQQCWAEDPNDRPSFDKIATLLLKPEYHFVGTNEEEFKKGIPVLKLSSQLVTAFDTCNWRKLDDLLNEVTPDKADDDPELMSAVLSIFKGCDSERQARIVHMLPKIVNLPQFLSMKGYPFIVSLFGLTSIVVDETVDILRTIDMSSKAFRQQRLISVIAKSKNAKAIEFLADLCKCEDIGLHVAKHDLPILIDSNVDLTLATSNEKETIEKIKNDFGYIPSPTNKVVRPDPATKHNLELAVLKLYENLLIQPSTREFVKPIKQPLKLAGITIDENPELGCNVIASFPLDNEELSWETEIFEKVAHAADVCNSGVIAMRKLLIAMPNQSLVPFKELIEKVVKDHNQLYLDENMIKNLATFTDLKPLSENELVQIRQQYQQQIKQQNEQQTPQQSNQQNNSNQFYQQQLASSQNYQSQQVPGQSFQQQFSGQSTQQLQQQFAGQQLQQQFTGQQAQQQFTGQQTQQPFTGQQSQQPFTGQPLQQFSGQSAQQQFAGQAIPQQFGEQQSQHLISGQTAQQEFTEQQMQQQFIPSQNYQQQQFVQSPPQQPVYIPQQQNYQQNAPSPIASDSNSQTLNYQPQNQNTPTHQQQLHQLIQQGAFENSPQQSPNSSAPQTQQQQLHQFIQHEAFSPQNQPPRTVYQPNQPMQQRNQTPHSQSYDHLNQLQHPYQQQQPQDKSQIEEDPLLKF